MAGKKPVKKVLGKKALKRTRGGATPVKSAPRTNNEDKIAHVTAEMYTENVTTKFS